MEYKRRSGLSFLGGIITVTITVMSLTVALLILLDHKKKQEEKELDDYLEANIS